MTTSNSTNFKMNAQQIMDHAMTIAGIKGLGQPIDSETNNMVKTEFNIMIRHLETTGVRIWGIDKGILFPTWNQAEHQLPVINGGVPQAYACFESDYRQTATSTDIITGASSVDITADPGVIAGDYFGIWTSANGILWYTVDSIAGTTVDLFEVGTTTPASIPRDIGEGAIVCIFTDLVWQPLRIIEARRRNLYVNPLDNIDVQLVMIGKFDYERIPNKGLGSIPIQIYFQPFISQTTVWLWPVLDQTEMVVPFSFERRYQDVDYGVNDVDFPPEAYQALTNLLAARVGRLFRINGERQVYLDQISTQYYELLRGYASGATSMVIGVRR